MFSFEIVLLCVTCSISISDFFGILNVLFFSFDKINLHLSLLIAITVIIVLVDSVLN